VKLDIGAGHACAEGYTAVDLYPPTEILAPMWDLPFEDESIEAIRSCHSLEHVPRDRVHQTLTEWHRVLVDGGELWIEVPNLDAACKAWLGGDEFMIQVIYGSQDGPGMFHLNGFNVRTLTLALQKAGFPASAITEVGNSYGAGALRTTIYR
jgi:SAM-dependent methyltransferase